MTLREYLVAEVKAGSGCSLKWAESKADAILAHPEIREALLLMSTAQRRYLEAARPVSPAEIYGDALRNASPLALYVNKEDLP